MLNRPVFLCGHRKSGTTLLLNLLDGHTDLCVYPMDANYFYGYFPVYVEGNYSLEERKKRFERVVFTDLKSWLPTVSDEHGIDVDRYRECVYQRIGDRFDDMAVITDAMARCYQELTGQTDRTFVVKETSIEIYAQEIAAWHPGARFVQIVRDPRDNYAALKAGVSSHYSLLGEDEKMTLASLLNRARLGFLHAKVNESILGKDRYHVIRFEDLVKDPEQVLRRLCAFLGIAYLDLLQTPTKLGRPTSGNNFEGFDFSALSARNVGGWRRRISEGEAQVIEFTFAELMDDFGYARTFAPAEQARAAAEFYKWQNYRYFFSDRFAKA